MGFFLREAHGPGSRSRGYGPPCVRSNGVARVRRLRVFWSFAPRDLNQEFDHATPNDIEADRLDAAATDRRSPDFGRAPRRSRGASGPRAPSRDVRARRLADFRGGRHRRDSGRHTRGKIAERRRGAARERIPGQESAHSPAFSFEKGTDRERSHRRCARAQRCLGARRAGGERTHRPAEGPLRARARPRHRGGARALGGR